MNKRQEIDQITRTKKKTTINMTLNKKIMRYFENRMSFKICLR